jgi:hypothetical protein
LLFYNFSFNQYFSYSQHCKCFLCLFLLFFFFSDFFYLLCLLFIHCFLLHNPQIFFWSYNMVLKIVH